VLALLARMDAVLGFLEPEAAAAPTELLALLEARQAARKAKNWSEADRLRQEITRQGWVIEDTPKGPRLKKG